MVRVALISGISGQDGSYMADMLLAKNYYVWGIIRKSSSAILHNINHLMNSPMLTIKYGDLSDQGCLIFLLQEISKTYTNLERLEIYNLGAMSHVQVSFEEPLEISMG